MRRFGRAIVIAIAVIVGWNIVCGFLIVGGIVGSIFGFAITHANTPIAVAAKSNVVTTASPSLASVIPHDVSSVVFTVLFGGAVAVVLPLIFGALVLWRLWVMLPAIGWRLWALDWLFGMRARRN